MNEAASRPILLLLVACAVSGCGPEVNVGELQMTISTEIDRIASDYPDATLAVSVRDPQTGLTVDRNSDRLFHAASTMKVPVMIEIFRRAELGRLDLEDSIRVENAFRSIVDGSPFAIEDDSDDAIYERLGTPMSIRDLVFNMITISSNLATNILIDYVSADSVQATSERLGTRHMETLRGVEDLKAYEQGLSNRATAADLAVLLHHLMRGRAVSPEADAAMVEILSAQRFNEMIPAGLPEGTQVAHKTGQITRIHHDAAIVTPRMGESYVLVVMIEGLADDTDSAALGASIAAAAHGALRPTP
jgi:beta-lactamase class A